MKLEIKSININSIKKGSETKVAGRTLYVNIAELEKLITENVNIESVDIELIHPNDKIRVVNLMDVIQPRCKISEEDVNFPGFVDKIKTVGNGETLSLNGVTVLVCNPETTRKYNALLDMFGKGAELSRYSKMHHVSIAPHCVDGTDEREFENSVKIAGFKAAVYLAKAAKGVTVDNTEIFDLDLQKNVRKNDLPRIAYYYQLYSPQHDHNGVSDNCFYGTKVENCLPSIIHPNEVIDGGVVGHYTIRSLDTYSIQNHAIIKELYRRNGVDINFAGVVWGVANMEPIARIRKAMIAANLVKNVLGADGVVLTKIHGGMPHVDLAAVAIECEKLGMKTAVFTQPLISEGTLEEMLLFNDPKLDLIITVGATLERVVLGKADKIIGGTKNTECYSPDPVVQHAGDDKIVMEQFIIAGIHDHLGGSRVIVKQY